MELSEEDKLDMILNYCKSIDPDSEEDKNNYVKNQRWGDVAKATCGGNGNKFTQLVSYLQDVEKVIERTHGGMAATSKGKTFEGYVNRKKRIEQEHAAQRKEKNLDINLKIITAIGVVATALATIIALFKK
jgi:hypothetical protein